MCSPNITCISTREMTPPAAPPPPLRATCLNTHVHYDVCSAECNRKIAWVVFFWCIITKTHGKIQQKRGLKITFDIFISFSWIGGRSHLSTMSLPPSARASSTSCFPCCVTVMFSTVHATDTMLMQRCSCEHVQAVAALFRTRLPSIRLPFETSGYRSSSTIYEVP